MKQLDILAATLVIVGALHWGLVAIARFDLVAWIFGKDFGGTTAFRRPAQPEEVAPAYVFLASPVTGSYITGLVLPVIGGVTGAMSSQKP